MPPRPLLLALSALTLCACSTPPLIAPAQIPPPAVALASPCPSPADLPAAATGQDLAEWAAGWVQAYGCERGKRAGLLESWPH